MGLVQFLWFHKTTKWPFFFSSHIATTPIWCWIWRTLLFCLPTHCRYIWLITKLNGGTSVVFYHPVYYRGVLVLHPHRIFIPGETWVFFFTCSAVFRSEQLPVSKQRLFFSTGTFLKGENQRQMMNSGVYDCTNDPGWVEGDGWGDGQDVGVDWAVERPEANEAYERRETDEWVVWCPQVIHVKWWEAAGSMNSYFYWLPYFPVRWSSADTVQV